MCSIVNVALNPLDTVHFRTWRDENIRQSARGSGRRYPALVPSEQGRTSKRMSCIGVYSRKSVGWLWFCMFLVSTGFLHQQTMGATEVECLMHEDCKPGQFCAYVPNIDSYEGWRFAISTCKACSQCVCHFSSTTNRCPQERCPGTPTHRIHQLEGNFVSASQISDEDICLTSFTVRASFFRMMSSRVQRAVYDSAYPALPSYLYVKSSSPEPNLCDFPDAPGAKEGKMEILPGSPPEMTARAKLFYFHGLPLGTTRIVEFFDDCPFAMYARFTPIEMVKTIYPLPEIGLETRFYTFVSNGASRGYALRTYTNGETKFKFIVASTAPGQRKLSGTYSGFFEYGTTRRSADDIGDIESILCNITFSFEVGLQGVVPWDQHTWGCGRRIPQVNGVPEPNYLKHLRHNTRDTPTISTLQKDINERRKVTGEGAPEGEAGNIGQESPLRIESQTSFRRQLILGDDKYKAETCSKATPGSHVIYETTEAGLTALGVDFNRLFQTDSQWACANGGSPCCDVCAAGSYQPFEDNSQTCLSCPAYFTNNKRGSASLSECCAPQNSFGIYNARIQTSFNEFGILRHLSVLRNADRYARPAVKELKIWEVNLFSTHYICSDQSPDPGLPPQLPPCTSEGSFSPPERAGLFEFPFQTPASCCQVKKAESFNISMTPTFIPSKILYDKENAYDDQFGGDLCEDVVFTIQPMIGIDAVASLLELDFGCPNCFLDLGPNGSMKVSIFSVATQDIMPPELVLQATAPPKVSKVRDPIYEGIKGNEAFSSRNWEESYASKPNYEYDLEVLDRYRQLQDFFECNASTFNASKVEDEEIERRCFLPPKRLLLGQEFILNQTYSSYIGQDNQSYACEYEDPALGSSRYKPWPWLGIQLPRCQDDYKRRLRMQEDLVFKNFQKNFSRKADQTNIHKIGIRIRARVTPGLKQDEPYAGFRLGYKWFNSEHVCHAGSFSTNGSNGGPPCFLCPAGKFTSVDGQLWSCFDCPRGMYAEKNGSTQCSLCPSGKSTTKRGANSTDECRYYCRAGSFSRFGVEPCTLCERGKTQSKVGAVYCEQCPQGFTTFERGFTGFNNTPWTCYDARGLTFELEEFRLVGSRFSIRLRWKLPADRLHVEDIIALFKGDPMTSKRQLTWSYASAASIDSDTTCWDVAQSGIQSACRNPGSVVRPWASISFNIDSAGPGTYSVVYFAQKSLFRAFTVSHSIRVLTTTDIAAMSLEKRANVEQVCPNPEQDCCEMLDLRSKNNIQLICPRDSNQWETDTGMFTCKKGQYLSEYADLAPCFDCPRGTVSSSIGSTKCTACDQGFYANPLCSGQGQCPQEFSQAGVNLKPREKCFRCPEGTSTLTDKSERADCKLCPELFELTSNDIPFCVSPQKQRTTIAVVQTTPAPPTNCGNGIQIFPEQCDDNNTASSDGCSDVCTTEEGWFCFQQDGKSASRCRAMVCGDGIREYSEQCDDGNLVQEDCCSQKCRIDEGCRCAGEVFGRSRCETLPVCGDFIREWTKGETCDDGNLRPGDGCSSNCRQEANYICRNDTIPDMCCADLVLCGNGILEKCEECDDGNGEDNDGCSNRCKVEDFYQCRDGCSGPLCQSEFKCKEPLIGRKPQVTLQQGSAIKGTGSGTVYKWGMGILTWLNISDTFSETVPVTIEETPRLIFDIPVALEVQSGVWPTKRIGGSNLVGYSTGLLLRMQQGPNEFSTLNMMTAKSDSIFASIQEMGFRGIYGRGGTTSQLACTFCSGLQKLQWPSGIISEPIGMMIKDKTCHFIVDGAVDLMWSIRQSPPFNAQDYQESTFHGVEITIHEIGFRSNDELLSVEVERSICDIKTGLKCSDVGNYTKVFRRGTTAPIKLQMKPPVRIGFIGKSHLLDLERNLPWDIPATSAVRFKLSYKSLRIGQAGESCCIDCRYDPDCIQASACFAGATEVTIPSKRTHVIFDRLKKYVEQRSAQDVSAAFRSRRAAFEYEEGEEESDAQEGESFWTLPHASGDSRIENSQQASITGSPQTETRRSESGVDKLTLAFDGAVGIELNSTDLPCAFAQSERQILTVVERRPDVWRGAEGAWDGKCYINPSCSAPEVIDDKSGVLKTRCLTGGKYFDPPNLCSIRIEISDRIIREYRYGCDGSATFTSTSADVKINGSAHGVIVSVGQQTLNEYSGADVRVLAYRRVEVVWTRSSLADRPVGVLFKGYLSFGESEELGAQGKMQIYWGRRYDILCPLGACDPLLFFDSNAARFIPREGECRNMDLEVAKNVIITADNFLASGQGNNNLPDLLNLRQYLECNATFQQLQSLAIGNFECKRVLDVLLFRDAETAITNIDEKLCKSGCLSEVQNLLGSTVKTCSARWKEGQFSGVYANVLFKKLYIAATALAWSKVVCYVNQYEERCTRTINDYADLFGACSIFRTTHGLEATFALNKSIHGLLKNGGQGQEVCPSACIEALIKYQNQDGCCAASVSEAASFWANSILADTREPFTVDLGETANPWTPLGAGTGNKMVNVNRHCTNSRFILHDGVTKGDSGDNPPAVQNTIYPIYPQCLMSTAEYCGNPSWRPPCCDFPCLNGGTKAWSGDCYCSCPVQYVGADCSQKKIYVRFSMEVFGEDKLSYHYGKQQYTQRALESVIASNALQEVQWDSIKEVKRQAKRNLQQHAPSVKERDRGREGGREGGRDGRKRDEEERRESEPGSVRVLLRFIYVSSREAARMQGMFLEDEDIWSKLQKQVAVETDRKWSAVLDIGEHPPLLIDANGLEVCDDMKVKCYLGKKNESTYIYQHDMKKEGSAGFNVDIKVLIPTVAALGGVLAALLIGVAAFWWTKSEGYQKVRKRLNVASESLSGIMTPDFSKKRSSAKNRLQKTQEEEYKIGMTVQIVNTADNKMSKRGDPSGFLLRNFAAGQKNTVVSLSSSLVFQNDASTSGSSGNVPAHYQTAAAHAKLSIQGKGELTPDSEHSIFHVVKRDDFRPKFDRFHITQRSSVKFATLDEMEAMEQFYNPNCKSKGAVVFRNSCEGAPGKDVKESNPLKALQRPKLDLFKEGAPVAAFAPVVGENDSPENPFYDDDAAFKREQILKSLRSVKQKQGGTLSAATSLSQPRLLSNPDASYLVLDGHNSKQAIVRSPSGRGGQQPANSRELSRQGSLSNMSNPLSRTDVANTSMPSAVKSGKKSQRFGAFSLPVSHAQAESFVSSRSERSSTSILGEVIP